MINKNNNNYSNADTMDLLLKQQNQIDSLLLLRTNISFVKQNTKKIEHEQGDVVTLLRTTTKDMKRDVGNTFTTKVNMRIFYLLIKQLQNATLQIYIRSKIKLNMMKFSFSSRYLFRRILIICYYRY